MPVSILMPALSPTMTEGNLVKWMKKEGDTISAGDVIAEIETDKATMEVEAVDEGTLGKIVVAEGTEGVLVNQVIGVILEEGEDKSALKDFKIDTPEPAKEEKKTESKKDEPAKESAPQPSPKPQPTQPVPAQAAPQRSTSGGRISASPLAKRIAEQSGVNLQQLSGSGPRGRIIKADVEKAIASGPSLGMGQDFVSTRAPGEMPPFDMISLNNVRKITAKRLTEAKQIVPHFYLTIDVEVTKLLELRKDLNETLGEKVVSVNDLILKACGLALRKVPEANASWQEDHIRQYHAADISLAVAIPNGLITPVVRDADRKSVVTIAKEAKELAKKARDGKLKPEEFQGGTFSLSNLGMFGIQHFGAIINPPQGCILAVGAAEQRPIVESGEIKVGNIMNCTLSVDHRVVDGATGANFLAELKQILSKPVSLLI